ncbi:SAM-dependent methyltransferase [Asanoa siamensis]|uniref:S-adenosyl-L-methionine-dependent methyltransferase n=1 Tax=Asanoa siamensis TaxID=926357 RepID=A0ABQ4CUB9_9ACTN|nr:SAM-dependent methyltransferase [Asanoa siamensis]GIF74879.1 S-adenosyl-L-methionine-dependent methyltransferase [Asanoa siamensis]
MASIRVETTAIAVATMRALEADVPPAQRLLDDPVSAHLLTGVPGWIARHRRARLTLGRLAETAMPGVRGTAICRTRVIDDWCRDALAAGARQVVVLGAGLDSRPYRLAELAAVPVWELDLPGTQALKRAALARVPGPLPANIRYLAADVTVDPLAALLADAGFDAALPTLVVFEAVAQYLPPAGVTPTFVWAGSLAPGSRLVLTYLPDRVRRGRARASRRYGWLSAYDPAELPTLLAAHGLTLRADVGAEDYPARYPQLRGRRLTLREIERVALAEVSR